MMVVGWGLELWDDGCGLNVQGYLAHKKQPRPLRATIGPWASHCRVLGGDDSYERGTHVEA